MKHLFLIIVASLVVACSSTNDSNSKSVNWKNQNLDTKTALMSKLQSLSLGLDSINKLPFQLLSLNEDTLASITDSSPIINFPEGNSFVAALQLPYNMERFTIEVESRASSSVFVPNIIFLDQRFEEVTRLDDAQFDKKGAYVIEEIFSDTKAQEIQYMLVFTKQSQLNGRTEIVNVAREYELSKGKSVSDIEYPRLYASHSPIGKVNVRLTDVFVVPGDETSHETPQHIEMLSDTENYYLKLINIAIDEDNLTRAKRLADEAMRAGSTKAITYYLEELAQRNN